MPRGDLQRAGAVAKTPQPPEENPELESRLGLLGNFALTGRRTRHLLEQATGIGESACGDASAGRLDEGAPGVKQLGRPRRGARPQCQRGGIERQPALGKDVRHCQQQRGIRRGRTEQLGYNLPGPSGGSRVEAETHGERVITQLERPRDGVSEAPDPFAQGDGTAKITGSRCAPGRALIVTGRYQLGDLGGSSRRNLGGDLWSFAVPPARHLAPMLPNRGLGFPLRRLPHS